MRLLILQTHLWQLGRLVPTRLCTHLESIGVLPLLYGASWLMTCFSADFPASFSARCDVGWRRGMHVSTCEWPASWALCTCVFINQFADCFLLFSSSG